LGISKRQCRLMHTGGHSAPRPKIKRTIQEIGDSLNSSIIASLYRSFVENGGGTCDYRGMNTPSWEAIEENKTKPKQVCRRPALRGGEGNQLKEILSGKLIKEAKL